MEGGGERGEGLGLEKVKNMATSTTEKKKTKNNLLGQQQQPYTFYLGPTRPTDLQLQRLHELLDTPRQEALYTTLDLIANIYFGTWPRVSLRKVDWMVTNYSKTINNCIAVSNSRGVRYRGVQETYLHWRRNFKRIIFDPFRRTEPVYFTSRCGQLVHTSVAQISFFWFLVLCGLDSVLLQEIDRITSHQQKQITQRKADRSGVKRQSLTTANKSMLDMYVLTGFSITIQL